MASIVYCPDSSNFGSISWAENQPFLVLFKHGTQYWSKEPMPKTLMLEWMAAPSAGGFFHERIKGSYELEKVQDGAERP